MLPNYERIPVGEREALEAGAFIARTGDANANWYNPAGLALAERTAANVSASAYEASVLEVASVKRRTDNLRLSPIGSFFGLVIGPPIVSGSTRYGAYIAQPLSWRSGTLNDETPVDATTTFGAISDANLTRYEPGIALGMRAGAAFRLGAALGVSVTTMDLSQDLVVRRSYADSVSSLRRTLAVSGTSWDVVARIGMQWDLPGQWRFGAVATAPGLQMFGSTRLTYGSSNHSSAGRYIDVSLRDEEADFEYRLPFSAGAGLARLFSRGAVEATVRYFGSVDEYDMISSDVLATQIDAPAGGPPVTTTLAVAPITNSWREVVNVAVGGNYAWTKALLIHLGVTTDNSPVADPERSAFRKVHLVGGTAGVSYQGESFGGSLGLGYSAGSSDPIEMIAADGAPPVETRIKVRTFRAMYSFTARF
jgi:hypothetical protein